MRTCGSLYFVTVSHYFRLANEYLDFVFNLNLEFCAFLLAVRKS